MLPLLDALPSGSRSLTALLDRLRRFEGTFALHETSAAARPYILAAVRQATSSSLLIVTPTPDVAERTFADLQYFLGAEAANIHLMRSREETVGALESPSERSARMSLLASLAVRNPLVVIAPVNALRQYLMPPQTFRELSFTVRVGAEAGWEETLERLHHVGYRRSDVVGAAGEYAVRGGIIDLFAASADRATRIEFFGDTVESIRPFDLESQRSAGELSEVTVVPWSEIPRDEALRARVESAVEAPPNVISALRAYLASGADIPEAWLSLAYDRPATLLDYLDAASIVALEEPALLVTIETALDEERSREEQVALAGVEAGDLSLDEEAIGAALLAEVAAPHPTLADLAGALAGRRTLLLPGAIEMDVPWLPAAHESFVLETRPIEHFNRHIEMFLTSLRAWIADGETVVIITSAASRVTEILQAANVRVERASALVHARGGDGATHARPPQLPVFVDQGSIESGFALPSLRLRVLGDRELFGQPAKRVKLRAVKEGVPVTLADLKVGDYVVHAVHGIGQYLGLRTETIFGATSDYLDVRYAGTDRLLVPVQQMHQVGKYSASEGATARLSKMGGADWARVKGRISESLARIADELVALYAEREVTPGHAYPPDTPWQAELEEAFPYEETPDQQKAIDAVKADMERPRPMDRLVCGDVGYGKTEVAIRAAFKAITDQRQVAILVPTTLLAAQHGRTFAARLAGFPVRIEELSRFKTKKEQQATLKALAEGKVDIVVGTHRLLQKDVTFANLGLIVVDEEQRFGVMHKERLKEMRANVDVLTLSATPIPRTLHMSLLNVRDLSLIQTAPKNRMSIKTLVVPASDAVATRAINAELDRSGQIYYVHNRIETIASVANALQALVPRARIAIGHGAMTESQLEPIMTQFIEGEIDILVSTTIIENGIDIPNVNTIIVNNADMFGLAQLYQLRGRVGRSNHQAYAYLLYQGHKVLSEEAKARLEAIREFAHLGSGLQVAMRDIEIRGAGNLLGTAQSGFIGSVGFDTYCQLLSEAISARQGKAREDGSKREAVIDVKLDAFVPNDYIPQVSQKIAVYRQLADSKTEAQVGDIVAGVVDRFGPLPKPLENLVAITRLRTIAMRKGVTRVVIDERRLNLGVGSAFAIDAAAIPKLQSLTKNRFRFGEQKITVDLPELDVEGKITLVRALLEAL